MSKIDLSITIVLYHNYEDVKKAIETIEKYTNKNINKKIYLVDNGRENVEEKDFNAFKNFFKTYEDIEYIDAKSNLGFGKGHNLVLDKINSKYHAIIRNFIFCSYKILF